MKSLLSLLLVLLMALNACENASTAPSNDSSETSESRQFFQLKTYSFASESQLAITDAYLKEAFIPAMNRLGLGPIGVFKNRPDEKDSTLKTHVLISFDDIEAFLSYESKLANDNAYKQAGKAYIEASHDQKPYQRIGSVLMRAFEDMPQMEATSVSGPKNERVYELRSYESPTEAYYWKKVDMFNAGGEIPLFDRLNFNAVFYGEVISGPAMPNLMYMTTFPDMAVRDSLWKEFFASPEWTELKAMEKYKNSVSRADIHLLYPAEYSEY